MPVSSQPFRIPMSLDMIESSDPVHLPDAHYNVVMWLMRDYFYTLEEIPHASRVAFSVSYYIEQVANGGHGQFLGNGRMLRGLLDLVEEGLNACGVVRAQQIYRSFRTFLNIDHQRADRVADGGGFGEIEPKIRYCDREFLKLDRPALLGLLGDFLRNEADLEPVGPIWPAVEAVGRRNPHIESRWLERAAAKDAALKQAGRAHSQYELAKLLCDAAGRDISHVIVGWKSAPNETISNVLTAEGTVWMRAGPKLAILGRSLDEVTSRMPWGPLVVARHDGAQWYIEDRNADDPGAGGWGALGRMIAGLFRRRSS